MLSSQHLSDISTYPNVSGRYLQSMCYRYFYLPLRIRALSSQQLSQIFVPGRYIHSIYHRYFYLPVRIRAISSQHFSQTFLLKSPYPGAIFTTFVTDISTYPYVSGRYLQSMCYRYFYLPVRIRALSSQHLSHIFLLTLTYPCAIFTAFVTRTFPGAIFTTFVTDISTYSYVSGRYLHIICHRYFYLPVRIRALSSQHLSQIFLLTRTYPGAIFTAFQIFLLTRTYPGAIFKACVTDISTYPYVSGRFLNSICHIYIYLPVRIRALSSQHLSHIFRLTRTYPGAIFTAFITDISTYSYVSGRDLNSICHIYFYLPLRIRALSSQHLSQIFLLTRTYPGAIFTAFVTYISTNPYVSGCYLHSICQIFLLTRTYPAATFKACVTDISTYPNVSGRYLHSSYHRYSYPGAIFTAFITYISTYPYVSGRYRHSIFHRHFYLNVRIRALSSQHLSQIFLLTRTYPGAIFTAFVSYISTYPYVSPVAIFTAFVTDISTYPNVSGRYLHSICHRYFYLPERIRALPLEHHNTMVGSYT